MDDREDLTALLQAHRIGHLATANAAAVPHVVPVCFVYEARTIYSALDHKPKRLTGYRIKRIRNILENPHVAFLVHHYAENWQQLSYVLIQGRATILEQGAERQRALMLLEEKYEQYRERHLTASAGLVIKIVPETVRRWSWQESATLER
jgi:coenzyme F420-0:L-glutamate ligase / coenzyme F420-1:gamma-L-glutamate ligase